MEEQVLVFGVFLLNVYLQQKVYGRTSFRFRSFPMYYIAGFCVALLPAREVVAGVAMKILCVLRK